MDNGKERIGPFDRPMTIRELIDALQLVPQDATLYTEGCDCLGDVGYVEYRPPYEAGVGANARARPAEVTLCRTIKTAGIGGRPPDGWTSDA